MFNLLVILIKLKKVMEKKQKGYGLMEDLKEKNKSSNVRSGELTTLCEQLNTLLNEKNQTGVGMILLKGGAF